MRVGWYLARSVAAWFFGLCAIVCGLLIAYASVLPVSTAVLPSPWSLVGPLFFLATWITWARARRDGELTASAAGGTGFAACVPVAAMGLVLQGLFAIPSGRMPQTTWSGASVERGVGGQLFLAQRNRGILFLADGEVRIVGEKRPDDFKPAPHNPQRYRRQAFFTQAPRFAPQDPLDPWLWRWAYIVSMLAVPTLLMRSHRRWPWEWGALPLSLPLLVL